MQIRLPTAGQFTVLTTEFKPVARERPIIPQSIVVSRVLAKISAVLMPSPMVAPTRDQSKAPTNPFINVPIDRAIFHAVCCILPHGMLSKAVFIFSASNAPSPEKSAAAHASFIICERSANFDSIGSVSKASAGFIPPLSSPP